MTSSAVIEKILADSSEGMDLADLLFRIDCIDRSGPTLDELNDTFKRLTVSGDKTAVALYPVSETDFAEALALHLKRADAALRSVGVDRDHLPAGFVEQYLKSMGR